MARKPQVVARARVARWNRPRDVRRAGLVIGLLVALPVVVFVSGVYGTGPALRCAIGFGLGVSIQWAFSGAMRRRIGPERASPADLVTLTRAALGTLLLALVISGIADRMGLAGWLAFGGALVGATVTDWIDGPLARHFGPTRLGGVLDIETDSWLTLWSAAGAVAWGGLPWWCLLPPIIRYLHPLRALRRGALPASGGPWWSRVTGVAQMVLLLGALAPWQGPLRESILQVAALPISAAQLMAMLALLVVQNAPQPYEPPAHATPQ